MLLSDNADEQNIARTNRRCVGTFLLLTTLYFSNFGAEFQPRLGTYPQLEKQIEVRNCGQIKR